jgi:protochlorophyllide reductase
MMMMSRLLFLLLPILSTHAFHDQLPQRCSPISSRKTALFAEPSRRQVLDSAASLTLSSLLIGQRPAIAEEPLTIVMTGANSGIGLEATKRLAQQGHKIVLVCRTMEKAQSTIDSLKDFGGTLVPAECDLTNLSSIQSFAKSLDVKIDRLCLNAGVARNIAATDCARTADGFELTVGTNHFGHFYLNSLLLPKLDANGRIVVTASIVHDPESPGGDQGELATLGDLNGLSDLGKNCEMIDGGEFNAEKAYKDSKLCNVLFTRELQRRLGAKNSNIAVNCYNPGLIVGTQLYRDQNALLRKLFDFAATDLLKVGETPSWGGGCLTYMTTKVNSKGLYYSSDPGSSKYGDSAYGNQFDAVDVSKEAQDDEKAKRLWELSEKALGLS